MKIVVLWEMKEHNVIYDEKQEMAAQMMETLQKQDIDSN
jgi:hypothetical protein